MLDNNLITFGDPDYNYPFCNYEVVYQSNHKYIIVDKTSNMKYNIFHDWCLRSFVGRIVFAKDIDFGMLEISRSESTKKHIQKVMNCQGPMSDTTWLFYLYCMIYVYFELPVNKIPKHIIPSQLYVNGRFDKSHFPKGKYEIRA